MQYGTYSHELNVDQHNTNAQALFKSNNIKYTGAKNFNYFIDVPNDVNKTLSNYFSDKLGHFDWAFQYFHSGEPAGLHTDYTVVPWDDKVECRVDVGVIVPLEWNCKQPYTINYNRAEEFPRKVVFRKGEMRYTDNNEIINYRQENQLDQEVAKYNPSGTEYYKLYYDLKVHSVYKWEQGTAMVFDTRRWHSSSWFLTDNKLPDVSTEYKRAIIGFGSTDVQKGK
jgi:hypothetical protein|tara:strand:- start:5974 stop:6648 length:675 start_codon:yes stop_codon:yes gene_type:complete